MLHIWQKQISSVAPDEIKKAMMDYEGLNDDDVKTVITEEIKSFELTNESPFKEYYIKYTDMFPFDLWNTEMINITFEQLRDYLVDIEELSDDELKAIINDLMNVLGVDVNDSFRNFFIKFMDVYSEGDDGESVENKFKAIEEINDIMNIPASNLPTQRTHEQRKAKYDEKQDIDDFIYEERRHLNDDYDFDIDELMKLRNEIDEKIKELQQEEKENNEFINTLLNLELNETDKEKEHKRKREWRKSRAKEMTIDELKQEKENMKKLKETYNDFEPLNDEMDNYVRRHGIRNFEFDDYGVLTLFPPIDKEGYIKEVRKLSYKKNEVKVDDHSIYKNYYLNKPTSLDEIENLINRIGDETLYPFKIICDVGFIVEDTKEVKYSKTFADLTQQRSIPTEIKKYGDLKNYYDYILSYLSEKMEETHKSSSHHYIGIYVIAFRVNSMQVGKKNDFEITDVVGAVAKVPVYFKNSKDVLTGFGKLETNYCVALAAIIAKNMDSTKKISQNMIKKELKQLLKEVSIISGFSRSGNKLNIG